MVSDTPRDARHPRHLGITSVGSDHQPCPQRSLLAPMPQNADALDLLSALESDRREAGQVVHAGSLDRLPAHDRVKDRAPQVQAAQAPIRRAYPAVARPDVGLGPNGAGVADRRPDPKALHRRYRPAWMLWVQMTLWALSSGRFSTTATRARAARAGEPQRTRQDPANDHNVVFAIRHSAGCSG